MGHYVVFVDDNYHYMDDDASYEHGTFASAAEAVEACKKIVERCLVEGYKPGITPSELLSYYRGFGDDPYIVTMDSAEKVAFSAWTYAEERCGAFIAEREGS